MGRNFWPIYFSVAALGAAAIWSQVPRHVEKMPPALRSACRALARTVTGLPQTGHSQLEKALRQFNRQEEEVVLLGGTSRQEAASAPPADRITPKPEAPVVSPPNTTPVKPVNVAAADWCVLAENTPVESLDDKPLSVAPGGRFFLIERRARAADGNTALIGNFTPKRLPHTVQINSRHVLCLSGMPDDLSTSQLHALKMYYQLRGEARDYLAEMRKSSGDIASPLFKRLQEAERIRDFRAKELEHMTSLKGDQLAVEREELEKLKRAAEDLREQHDDWKKAHRLQVQDPTKDPHYLELVREYRRYAETIPAGLTLD